MITKHFFKTLLIFTGMILVGLVGVFLVSYLDQERKSSAENSADIAK